LNEIRVITETIYGQVNFYTRIRMRAVVQRVSRAQVSTEGGIIGEIQKGLLVLLGVAENDTETDANWMVQKVLNCRIFPDQNKKMNLSLIDINGEALIVSQFTLFANIQKGNRPSFIKAANPTKAQEMYEYCIRKFNDNMAQEVQTGSFGAMMDVSLNNAGPVTIIFDSHSKI